MHPVLPHVLVIFQLRIKFCLSKMRRRQPFSSLCCEAISLSCLACHGVNSRSESFRSYSVSDSDGEGRCGATMNCWRRRTPTDIANSAASSQASPRPVVTSQDAPGTPRLVRCRAVRRDIFEDWHFDDMAEDVQRPEE